MRRPRRLLSWLMLSALLILMPPAIMLGVLATGAGSAWTLQKVGELARSMDVRFTFAHSSGSLLRRLELRKLVLEAGGSHFEAERVLLQWRPVSLLQRKLHIQAFEISAARFVTPPPTDKATPPPDLPELSLPVLLELDRLSIEHLVVVQGDSETVVSRFLLGARLDRQGLSLHDLQAEGAGMRLHGALEMQARAPHVLRGELQVYVDEALSGDDIGRVEARAQLDGPLLSPAVDLAVHRPTPLRLRGTLKLDQDQPGFDLIADWPGLNWPLQGKPEVTLDVGNLTLKGVADNYRLTLRTKLLGDGMPDSDIDLDALGNLDGLTLQPLRLATLEGRLLAEGRIDWREGLHWDLLLNAEHLNPGLQLPEWPGELDGRLQLGGTLAAGSGDLTVHARIDSLSGRLRDYPVSAEGALDYRADRLQLRSLQFASGPNHVRVDGFAGESLDLGFDIEAPDLASLYPGLAGTATGAGKLKGTWRAPFVVVNLSGQAVRYADLLAREFKLDVDWREQGGKGQLQLSGARAGGFELARLTADLDGSPESHRLDLAAESESGSVALSAQGGLQEQIWHGELQRLSLTEPALGEWLLQTPAKLSLGAKQVSSSRLCIGQAAAAACVEGGWDPAAGVDIAGSLTGLDLARLSARLPGEAVIQGEAQGEFSIKGLPTDPEVRFELAASDGLIRVEEIGEPIALAYRDARINGQFRNDQGNAELGFGLGTNGRAQGRLSLGPEKGGRRSLGGEIDADFPDLALVSGFVPALEQVQGRLHLEAILGGTLDAPQLTGVLEVLDARAQLAASGVELNDIELVVTGSDEGPLAVRAQVSSGEGRLDIKGTADLATQDGPEIDIVIQGQGFRAVQLPEASVDVSPDLRLRGSGPYHLSGRVLIPRAEIELKELPSGTVAVSDDEIIIGGDETEQRRTVARNLTALVRVELGDAVRFDGFGLKTRLLGALDASVDAQGAGVDGRIELREGRFTAYGQDLTVERGRLLFAGPPGNPDVDLRAVRVSNSGDVRAYLVMTGPLSRPRPRIYSEPALSETEALAYLVTGNGLGAADDEDGFNIASAALALGLTSADPAMQKLTAGLGLDEISIDSGEDALEDSSLTLGKYLNPDLYIGYSQGLFNPEGAVLMRLQLRKQLSVESSSGNEQSVDLIYRIEH